VAHTRAVGAVADLRRLAVPGSLGLFDTSLGQQDVQSLRLRRSGGPAPAHELAYEVLAIELLTARQAWALRGRPPAPGLAALADVHRVLALMRHTPVPECATA
jgi:histidine ammonia-lyase